MVKKIMKYQKSNRLVNSLSLIIFAGADIEKIKKINSFSEPTSAT